MMSEPKQSESRNFIEDLLLIVSMFGAVALGLFVFAHVVRLLWLLDA